MAFDKCKKEIGILLFQIGAFYLLPLFAGPTDIMGMVVMLILVTFTLALLLGLISGSSWKYLYPLAVAAVFVPSVFLYYNDSAMIHAVWYLVISAVGLLLGAIMRFLMASPSQKA